MRDAYLEILGRGRFHVLHRLPVLRGECLRAVHDILARRLAEVRLPVDVRDVVRHGNRNLNLAVLGVRGVEAREPARIERASVRAGKSGKRSECSRRLRVERRVCSGEPFKRRRAVVDFRRHIRRRDRRARVRFHAGD